MISGVISGIVGLVIGVSMGVSDKLVKTTKKLRSELIKQANNMTFGELSTICGVSIKSSIFTLVGLTELIYEDSKDETSMSFTKFKIYDNMFMNVCKDFEELRGTLLKMNEYTEVHEEITIMKNSLAELVSSLNNTIIHVATILHMYRELLEENEGGPMIVIITKENKVAKDKEISEMLASNPKLVVKSKVEKPDGTTHVEIAESFDFTM